MIHKFQNIHGISYNIPPQLNNFKQDFAKLIDGITEDKKAPFSDVYVKMPLFWLDKFLGVLSDKDLKYKELEIRHEKALIKL